MMSGMILETSVESGYGLSLSGFHGSTMEFPGKLRDLLAKNEDPDFMIQAEENGYVTFLVGKNLPGFERELHCVKRIAFLRREPHRFFPDLGPWLKNLFVSEIIQASLTGSSGSLTLTLLYKPAPGLTHV